MLKVAIVEDDRTNANELIEFLKIYEKDSDEVFDISHFENGLAILGKGKFDYDIVFMDVEMPKMNGMETAKQLRKLDDGFCLIFVTGLIQYAVDGYELNASDFMVKPLKYFPFAQKMSRILKKIYRKKKAEVVLSVTDGKRRVFIHEIRYVEVRGHAVLYHLKDETVQVRDTLINVEKQLSQYGFAKCNSCYLVNLSYVSQIAKNYVIVENDKIQVSRSKHVSFMTDYARFLGGK